MSHPRYIPNTACENDELANSPHESVANTLKSVITNPEYGLTSRVIGLEGEWGSGKSTVINILNKKWFKTTLEDNYLCKLLLDNEKQVYKSYAYF